MDATSAADTGTSAANIGEPSGGGTTTVVGIPPGSGASSDSADTGAEGTSREDGADTGAPTPAEIKKWTYRSMRENGQYEDEDLDEDGVRARLSDDYEHTLKVDKEERRMPLHQVKRWAQLGITGGQRMEQANKLKAEYEERMRSVAEDTYAALDEADGYNFQGEFDGIAITKSDSIALKRVAELYQLKQLREQGQQDPMAISRYMKLERERNDRLRAAKEAASIKTRERQDADRRQADVRARMEPEVVGALKAAGLRDNDRNRGRMAARMKWARNSGYEISLIDAAQFAREEWENEVRGDFDGVDGNRLSAILGPKLLKLVREAEIKKLEAVPGSQPQQQKTGSQNRPTDLDAVRKAATAAARGTKAIRFSIPQ